jgi:hypothetical protein
MGGNEIVRTPGLSGARQLNMIELLLLIVVFAGLY